MIRDFENSTFTLTTKEDFSNFEDSHIVKVIEKLHIIKNSDKLLTCNENNYLSIINYLENIYYLKEDINTDIKNILDENIFFNNYLIEYVNKKLNFLLKNGSAIFFKDIIAIINLLSRGEYFKVFEDYNTINYDEISKLFRHYEKCLNRAKNKSKDLFNVIFISYTTLLKVFNKLCLVNSTDIKRKQTITPITNLLTESINILKFTTQLNNTHLNRLNNILGQILYYFSHLPFVDSNGKDINYLIDEYYLLFEKICDGYQVSKEALFIDNISSNEEEYLRFRSNSSYLLLIMLKKLYYNYKPEEYFIINSFKRCMLLYERNFSFSFVKDDEITIDSFRYDLLNALALKYETKNSKIGEIKDYKVALNDFIIEADNYNIHNLETIHDILLLAEDVDEYFYINIGLTLINSPLIKNDYYEFFKLKTLDIILNFLTSNSPAQSHKKFVKSILAYIDRYKVASHLMPMFSKLYLSISSFFAKLKDDVSIEEARDIYLMFVNINGYELLENEYQFINNELLKEFGRYQLKELAFKNDELSDKELLQLGKNSIKNNIKYKELKIKYEINQELAQIFNNVITNDDLNYEKLNFSICSLLDEKIFYGIAEISILGLTRKNSSIVDEGYIRNLIKIDDKFSLQFIFPAIYETNFKYIMGQNKQFILSNLENILSVYKKESSSFINENTNLENIHKLKMDLKQKEGINSSFVLIFISSLSDISKKYGFDVSSKYLNTIISKVKDLLSNEDEIYYLNDGLLGISLNNKDKVNEITDKMFKFKIRKNGEELNINFIISVILAKQNVYDKALKTLNKAIISKTNLLFYEE